MLKDIHKKKFVNSKGYVSEETKFGEFCFETSIDDGLGTKTFTRNDLVNSVETIRIEEVASQKTIDIEKGPHYYSKLVNDGLRGVVEVEKTG